MPHLNKINQYSADIKQLRAQKKSWKEIVVFLHVHYEFKVTDRALRMWAEENLPASLPSLDVMRTQITRWIESGLTQQDVINLLALHEIESCSLRTLQNRLCQWNVRLPV